MLLLTFAIPTFNRAHKVLRLLSQLEDELKDKRISCEVEVLVSDNCSEDETESLIGAYVPNNFKIRYVRQPRNLGFDGNIDFLYRTASSRYVWFFSDDDVLISGAVRRVVEALQGSSPEALLFSFQQPPGNRVQIFNGQSPCYLISDPKEIIEHLGRCVKISIYVLKTVDFDEKQLAELDKYRQNGFYFLDLAFSIFNAAAVPKLCVIPEQLAACDAEFLVELFDPWVIRTAYTVYSHPYVAKHSPQLMGMKEKESYYSFIDFLFAYKTGLLTARNPGEYEKGISSLELRPLLLLVRPKSMFKYVLLKTRLAKMAATLRKFKI